MSKGSKRERFVDEYLVDLNATQAAKRSGYSKKSARSIGSELLSDPEIQISIQNAKASRSKRTKITQDKVLRELATLAFSDIMDFAVWGQSSAVIIKPSSELKRTSARALSEVSNTANGLKVKLHSKPRALELLARHLGLFSHEDEAEKTLLSFADLVRKAAKKE